MDSTLNCHLKGKFWLSTVPLQSVNISGLLLKTVESSNWHADRQWSCCWQAVNQLQKITKAQESPKRIPASCYQWQSHMCMMTYRARCLEYKLNSAFHNYSCLFPLINELKMSNSENVATSWTPEIADGQFHTQSHALSESGDGKHSSVYSIHTTNLTHGNGIKY